VIDEAELRRLTPEERRHLARTLGAIDRPHPLMDPRLRRRRRFGLVFMTACCVALACWIAILILTLPSRYTAPEPQLKLLLNKLKLELPAQPPPKITAAPAPPTPL